MSLLKKEYWKEVFSPSMIIKTTMQTIIGSMLVGSFFMLFSDFIFKPSNLNGHWELTLYPEKADARMNRCLDLTYSVLIMQKGVNIIASGEKIKDTPSNNAQCQPNSIPSQSYKAGKRKKIKITGFIETSYMTDDILTLSYYEGKKDKERFTIATLNIKENKIEGEYLSHISSARGRIKLIHKD